MKLGLTVIIPCRNEHSSIRHVVRDIDAVMYLNNIPGSIIVIDDNSTPPLLLDDFTFPGFHRTQQLHKNILGPGLGEALKTGITYAHSKFVIFMSGDGTDDSEMLTLYYKRLCAGYDCVFGQRRWTWDSVVRYGVFKRLISRSGNRLISLFFDRRYTDYTDIFKGYRLSVAHLGLNCRAKGFAFPLELCLRAMTSGARYAIVPTTPRGRIAGTSKFRLGSAVLEYLSVLARCLKLKYQR